LITILFYIATYHSYDGKFKKLAFVILALGVLLSIGQHIKSEVDDTNREAELQDASEQRSRIESTVAEGVDSIDSEIKKTIEEIQIQRDVILGKIGEAADSVIDELRLNSSEANNALDELRKQSLLASKTISNEVAKLQEFTENELSNLSEVETVVNLGLL
jgi:hypothetical protein